MLVGGRREEQDCVASEGGLIHWDALGRRPLCKLLLELRSRIAFRGREVLEHDERRPRDLCLWLLCLNTIPWLHGRQLRLVLQLAEQHIVQLLFGLETGPCSRVVPRRWPMAYRRCLAAGLRATVLLEMAHLLDAIPRAERAATKLRVRGCRVDAQIESARFSQQIVSGTVHFVKLGQAFSGKRAAAADHSQITSSHDRLVK